MLIIPTTKENVKISINKFKHSIEGMYKLEQLERMKRYAEIINVQAKRRKVYFNAENYLETKRIILKDNSL